MEKYQVIIVGAGPSGAACAKALCAEGIKTLIVEKETLPRNKVCSGILFGQTQELLKKYFGLLPPDEVFCEPKIMNASNIRQWSREKGFAPYVWELPKDGQQFSQSYCNIWRSRFDQWLVAQSGAPVRQRCLFRTYALEGDQVRVEIFQKDPKFIEPPGKGDPRQALYCDYLVGADGGSSAVRRIFDPSWWGKAGEVVVYQVYCRSADRGALQDGHWNVFFEPGISDILCCVHRKDSFLTLCVGGFKGRNIRAGMEAFKLFLKENFQVVCGEEERVEGCMLRQAPPDLGMGRILLTGEAAGFMYLNGEGISAALDSGYRAGKALARAIQQGGDSLELYRKNTADILQHMQVCQEQAHFLAV